MLNITVMSRTVARMVGEFIDWSTLNTFSVLSRNNHRCFQVAWMQRLKLHFQDAYERMMSQDIDVTATDWKREFYLLCKEKFKHTNQREMLLYLNVTAGNIPALSGISFKDFYSFYLALRHKPWLLQAAADQQSVLNYYYERLTVWYQDDSINTTAHPLLVHWALYCRQPFTVIDSFITNCADIYREGAGMNLLGHAIYHGDVAIIEHLVNNYSLSLEHHDSAGFTPLMLAILFNQTAIVEFLITQHANVNAKLAATQEEKSMRILANRLPDEGSVLDLAIKCNCNLEILDLLIQNGAVSNIMKPLHAAILQFNMEHMAYFIDKYPESINEPSHRGELPLVSYLSMSHPGLDYDYYAGYKLLRDRGARIPANDKSNANNQLLYHYAAKIKNGGLAIMIDLHHAGMKFDYTDSYNGMHALHIAATHGNTPCVSFLLDLYNQAPDLCVDNAEGKNVFYHALRNQDVQGGLAVLQDLLQRGADPNQPLLINRELISPLGYAIQESYHDATDLLLAFGGYCFKPYEWALQKKNFYVMRKCLAGRFNEVNPEDRLIADTLKANYKIRWFLHNLCVNVSARSWDDALNALLRVVLKLDVPESLRAHETALEALDSGSLYQHYLEVQEHLAVIDSAENNILGMHV